MFVQNSFTTLMLLFARTIRYLIIDLIFLILLTTALVAEAPFELPPKAELAKLQSALLETNKGNIYFQLFPKDAPWHVANFKYLADKDFYKNIRFHIHYPNYIIQGGSPSIKNPNAGPGYSLTPEFNKHKHLAGILGMARMQDGLNPQRRSSGSQFHIILGNAAHMDGSFTIFGKVVKGMDVVHELRKGDYIKKLRVYVRSNKSTTSK